MSSAKKITKKPAAHPPYADMVKKAIRELKERKGSSRQAVIKYIRANFKISATENVESFVRRSLIAGVKAGRFVHTKGVGASGSFRLAEKATPKKTAKPKAVKAKKARTPKKGKKASAKKAKKPAAPAASGDSAVAKPKKVRKSKTPKKPKVKSAAKPKKAKTPKRAGAKKTVAKKVAKK